VKDKLFGILQRVGRSFMLPIAILPVAGLLLGIGSSFTNETTLAAYHLEGVMGSGTVINSILKVMSSAGTAVFNNLALIFAMGVAIGMAKKEKEVAALSGAIAFIIMHTAIGTLIEIHGGAEAMLANSTTSVLGITSLQMGVFGGIIVGLGVAALHNRYYKIELPQVLSFFGGTRFVPIISSLVYLIVGIIMFFVWPVIQSGIYAVGKLVMESGYAGTLLYGFMERLLIPFGLHHVFYLPFWQTAVGGTATIDGALVEGAQNIFFAELASPNITKFSVSATRFMSGKFPLMIFGLPGAALAMYRSALPAKKKAAGGLLLSAALTSMLTGITEPLEFTFLFVAPALYGIHCVFAGCAYMLMHIFKVGVGMTFSGGLIDMFLFGVLQGNAKTNWIWIVIIGMVYFVVYYFLFGFLINKFNLKTPGREDNEDEVKLYRRADVEAAKTNKDGNKAESYDEVSAMITKGLGGKDNISDVDCCATRLRTTVFDSNKVEEGILKASGAAGVIRKGNGVQIIYGPKVTVIKSNLEDYLAESQSDMDHFINEAENTVVKECIIKAPIEGNAVELAEVKDGVFSEEMLGKGAAIEPKLGKVFAPFNGKIDMVFDTKHAIGLSSEDGVELLIHIGIDTVQLNGKYYDVHVKNGDVIKEGDLLAEFDIDKIKEAGYRVVTPVIVTNSDVFRDIRLQTNGDVESQVEFIKAIK
jgi:glucose-specific phosphotransferase system IIA component